MPIISAISPSSEVLQGDSVVVSIGVDSAGSPVTDLYGIGFRLAFNPQVIQVTGVTYKGFLGIGAPLEFSQVDSVAGFLAYSVTRTFGSGVSGRGTIAQVGMRIRHAATPGHAAILVEQLSAVNSQGDYLTLGTRGDSMDVHAYATQTIAISAGWRLVSSFVRPRSTELAPLLAPITSNLVFIKNDTGQLFWPAYGIDQIRQWDYREAYQLYLSAGTALTMAGAGLAETEATLSLSSGWQLMPYLLDHSVDASVIFQGLAAQILILKDDSGRMYWPDLGINTIGMLAPGRGYKLYMRQAATLPYSQLAYVGANAMTSRAPVTAELGASSGVDMTLALFMSGATDGELISVVTRTGRVVGKGAFAGGRAVLTVWGDNALTPDVVEGAREGSDLAILFSPSRSSVQAVARLNRITNILDEGSNERNLRFAADAILSAEIGASAAGGTLALSVANPLRVGRLINFTVPSAGTARLEAFDAGGRRLAILVDEVKQPGTFTIPAYFGGAVPGVVFLRLVSAGRTVTQKAVLLSGGAP